MKGENERQGKKVNGNTNDISSIKRVTKNNGKKFLLFRPTSVFHRSPALPSPLTKLHDFIFCLNKL